MTEYTLKMVIPSNLHLDQLILANNPDFPIRKDFLVYLVHLILTRSYKDTDEFVRLNSEVLQELDRKYRKHLDFLINCGVIEESTYRSGHYSKGYKLTDTYHSAGRIVVITDFKLINKLRSPQNLKENENCESTSNNPLENKLDYTVLFPDGNPQVPNYLRDAFNSSLTVDVEKGERLLAELYEREQIQWELTNDAERNMMLSPGLKHCRRMASIISLDQRIYRLAFDKTAGRLHTPLTSLKSILRNCISYNGKPLISVDIVNSQPYLINILLDWAIFKRQGLIEVLKYLNRKFQDYDNLRMLKDMIDNASDTATTIKYKELVNSGKFYEEFAYMLNNDPHYSCTQVSRKEAKKIVFQTLFSPNNHEARNHAMKAFKSQFPDVYKVLHFIKDGQHNTLACLLQNVEASLVLHKVCRRLAKDFPEFPLFTIHDSILTIPEGKDAVKSTLLAVLSEEIGIEPTLSTEQYGEE